MNALELRIVIDYIFDLVDVIGAIHNDHSVPFIGFRYHDIRVLCEVLEGSSNVVFRNGMSPIFKIIVCGMSNVR